MPPPLPSFVVVASILPIDEQHRPLKRDSFGRSRQQMHVRMHQLIIEEPEPMLLLHQVQNVQVNGEVFIALEMKVAVIAPDNDVIVKLAVLQSWWPAHQPLISNLRASMLSSK